jgi:hypothetical protein
MAALSDAVWVPLGTGGDGAIAINPLKRIFNSFRRT